MIQISTEGDEDLIKSYLAGNNNAFKKLIEKWHIQFCKKALWIVNDADLAKDIAQDTWQVIIDKLFQLKEPSKFGSWALRIVCNKSINALNRKNKEQIDLVSYQYSQHLERPLNDDISGLKKQLRVAIKDLPNNQRQVLILFYLESYSLKQISEMLEISMGTAKSRLFYAREKLKTILKNKQNKY